MDPESKVSGMGARVWYATIEQVAQELDVEETARAHRRIGRALGSATDKITGQANRIFYPQVRTCYAEWPNASYAPPWKLYLDDDNEIISIDSVTSGGVVIPTSAINLEPANSGPPYQWIEVQTNSAYAFSAGATRQRSMVLTGTFGYRADEAVAGELGDAIADATATTANVSDSSEIGTGSILRCGTERMIVTRRSMLTTAQTLQTPLAADNSVTTVAVTDGTKYFPYETILLDAERMLVVDVAGNNLIVRRAWDGTVLATHTGSTIYAPRALTVERGALGTTAAAHSDAAALYRYTPPALVESLAIAEALVEVLQGESGYARTVGSGENQRESRGAGLADIRAQFAQSDLARYHVRSGAV